jgi:hypothetical protein
MRVLLLAAVVALAAGAPTKAVGVRIAVDPRIELFSILCRLAGHPEYGRASTPYARAVDAHFAPFANHPAVRSTRGLRARWGIAHDAPISLAVHLDDSFAPVRPLAPAPSDLDARWREAPLDGYLAEVRAFARESGFLTFFDEQARIRGLVEDRYRAIVGDHRVIQWFDRTFGKRPRASYLVAPGLLTGPNAYGARAARADGGEDVVQVVMLEDPDADGVPRLSEVTLEVLVHELAHNYVNPMLDGHANQLRASAEPVFRSVEAAMNAQKYGTPEIMVNESVVRALTILFLRDAGAQTHALRSLAKQQELSFLWTPELADGLDRARRRAGGKLTPPALVATTHTVLAAWAQKAARPTRP